MRPCSQTTDTRRDASVAVVLCGGSVHACGGPHHQPHQEDIRAVEPATSRARSVPGQLVSRTRAPHQRNPSRAQRCVAAYCTCRGAGRTPHKPCTRVVSVGNDMRVGYRTLSEAICSSFGTTRQRISGLYRKSVRARVIPCAHHVFWCTVTWVCHVSGRSWGCGARLGIWYRPARPPNTPGPAATSHGGEPVACISGHGGFYWSGEAHMQTRAVCRSVVCPTHAVVTPRCANPQGSAQHKLRGVVKLYQSALIKPSSSRARAPQLFASRASGAASGVRSKDDPAIEAQFLTRTLVRELRMGANLTLVLTALAHAVVWRPCDRRALSEASPVLLRSPPSAGVLAHAQRLLSQRFALCPDLRTLATAVVEGGLQAVTTACRVRVGGCMRGDVQWCGVYGDSFPVLCVPRHANEPYASCSGHGH